MWVSEGELFFGEALRGRCSDVAGTNDRDFVQHRVLSPLRWVNGE